MSALRDFQNRYAPRCRYPEWVAGAFCWAVLFGLAIWGHCGR